MVPRARKHSVLCFLYSTAVVGRVLPRHRSLGIAWTVCIVFKNPTIKPFQVKSSFGTSASAGNTSTILVLLSCVLPRSYVSIRFDLPRYGLPANNPYAMKQIKPNGRTLIRATTKRGAAAINYNLSMRAGDIVALEIVAIPGGYRMMQRPCESPDMVAY